MPRTTITTEDLLAAFDDERDVLSHFCETSEATRAGRIVDYAPMRVIAVAVGKTFDECRHAGHFLARVGQALTASQDRLTLSYDAAEIPALKALCRKLYGECYSGRRSRPAMDSLGMDDPEAFVAGEYLLPLLDALLLAERKAAKARRKTAKAGLKLAA